MPAPAHMSKGRILVVEDSKAQADKIGEALVRDGYEVAFAPDGASAIRSARNALPDLVLLDMVLPDTSGVQVLRILKAATRDTFLPVIILSAQADLEARLKGLQNGAEDYIGKEAHEREVLARVETLLRIKQLQDRLREANERLAQLSVTDGLTGLFNHRHFQTRLREEFGRAQRHGAPLSLLMLDLDHFKEVNDRWLHPFGDKVLREAAVLIRNSLRDHDVSARYGGEEFAVVLPQAHLASAVLVGRRILRALREFAFVVDGERQPGVEPTVVHVTASCGVASFPGPDVASAEQLVRRADEALFKAKDAGRDRIWCFQGQYYEDDAVTAA